MVGIVFVSHSHDLAQAVLSLVRTMTGEEVPIAIAAGIGEDHAALGTDAMEIYAAIESVANDDGVLVLMDMGSALLSTEMALDFLDESVREQTMLCPFAFVEGAVSACVAAKIGASLQEVYNEASCSLTQKEQHLGAPSATLSPPPATLVDAHTLTVIVPNPQGLHARPVSQLIQKAALYDCETQIRNLTKQRGPVSVRSMTAMVGLEAQKGDEIELIAKGKDAEEAVKRLKEEIEKGLGDLLDQADPPLAFAEKTTGDTEKRRPVGISRGVVLGRIFYPEKRISAIPEDRITDTEKELKRLHVALEKSRAILNERILQASLQSAREQEAIFMAQAAILQDPEIIDKTSMLITSSHFNVAQAWSDAIGTAVSQYKKLLDPNLQLRALDLLDVSSVVLQQLGVRIDETLEIPEEGIIVIDDITPGEVARLDPERVKGVICLENGPSSHSAILLRGRGIPSIVLASSSPLALKGLPATTWVAMDGETGEILINPDQQTLCMIREKQEQAAQQQRAEQASLLKPAVTLDGVRIHLLANVGSAEDVVTAKACGAEGIGLFRTEFMFLSREKAPTEEEQLVMMEAILRPMKELPVIIRTLDAGGDKAIPYLQMTKEANPFLGVRAIRLCLRNEALFQQQLRAILRLSATFDLRIMFPLIATLEELRQAKEALAKAHNSLLEEAITHRWPIPTGMMMEVPSAAIMAPLFAREVDFISIGTNDLVQYTMAADRGNPALQTTLGKGLDPAVIRLITQIVDASKMEGIPVGICGEAASDSELLSLLLSLGINELSMSGRSIPPIKQWIRNHSLIT